ncbi:MAG: YraN family protein [Phycisphaeraceae bacterium]|nr:YraN family protein [Phycisphaeraceae bacterium]MCB9848105.1 YraN family protein [Phycisphaeraceae bacterium]
MGVRRWLEVRWPGRRPGRAVDGSRDPIGPAGERVAARKLRRDGYRVIARNVRTGSGEVDLVCVAPDRRTIVFVEVKTRRVGGSGAAPARRPETSVGAHKQEKLRRLAREVARKRGWTGRPLRIDVVAVEWPARGRPVVRHTERAVRG